MALPVNFKDDILDGSMGGKRRYKLIDNGDGTVSLEDVTEYTQVGSDFGAAQMNATNQGVNDAANAASNAQSKADAVGNTLEARTNGKVRIWEDGEGGNIEIIAPDQFNTKWQFDAYNGNLRVYRWVDGVKNTFVFNEAMPSGDIVTSANILDSLSSVVANTTAKKMAGALAVKELNATLTAKTSPNWYSANKVSAVYSGDCVAAKCGNIFTISGQGELKFNSFSGDAVLFNNLPVPLVGSAYFRFFIDNTQNAHGYISNSGELKVSKGSIASSHWVWFQCVYICQ